MEISLKSKINEIRLELSKEMNKSGKNTYSKYDYFQLKDFMPQAISLMNEKGVYAEFNMYKEKFELPSKKVTKYDFDENGVKIGETVTEEENFEYREIAILDVYNLDDESDCIQLVKDTASVNLQAAQPIQNLGGRNTYMKRYMYMDLFEINENDKVEEETGKPVKAETKTTKAATKPKIKEVSAKEVTPADFDPKTGELNVEEKPEEDLSGIMSMTHKVELANYIKSKGGTPKDVMQEIASELGCEVTKIKEADYDIIKEKIDSKLGGE